ncbi:hypothetical protein IPM09_01605 [Candidatus Saccharibacteria bacterium]|nr:MAG: hypothetical protein IPM09_01605 [Candidatus Saccharibacteria bacterium]
MNDDQFTKLFNYIVSVDKKLDGVIENMATKDDIRRLESVIDGYAAKLDTYAQEMAAMDHKIHRLERYIQVLADKAGVDLDAIHV